MIGFLLYILYITIAWIKEYYETGKTVEQLKENKRTRSLNRGHRLDFDDYLRGFNIYKLYYGKWRITDMLFYLYL